MSVRNDFNVVDVLGGRGCLGDSSAVSQALFYGILVVSVVGQNCIVAQSDYRWSRTLLYKWFLSVSLQDMRTNDAVEGMTATHS